MVSIMPGSVSGRCQVVALQHDRIFGYYGLRCSAFEFSDTTRPSRGVRKTWVLRTPYQWSRNPSRVRLSRPVGDFGGIYNWKSWHGSMVVLITCGENKLTTRHTIPKEE